MSESEKTCFVIMPFSDVSGYEPGHFRRVYDHLIGPACVDAGFSPIRGDDIKATNYIAVDIIHRILNSDLVVCDLSGRNANVMYELGVRQAFDLPVVLLKDARTDRVFDIQGLRTLEYDSSLRVDSVGNDRNLLSEAISATAEMKAHEVNSLVKLLSIEKASLGKPTEVSSETSLILSSLKEISTRLNAIEQSSARDSSDMEVPRVRNLWRTVREITDQPSGKSITVGENVYDHSTGTPKLLGILVSIGANGAVIKTREGHRMIIQANDPRYSSLSEAPF